MPPDGFRSRLQDIQNSKSSVVCVGIDPDVSRLPSHLVDRYPAADAVIAFAAGVIEATKAAACAYKLNLAFYEVLEEHAWRALNATLEMIPDDVLVIADGKRGDIGNSARFYARSVFERLSFDACTVSGYMGRDSVDPFLQYAGRGAFLLIRTSNPGGDDFQTLDCGGKPLYELVAGASERWTAETPGELGFVMGATDIDALRRIRALAPSVPLLIPGVGAQGGDASAVMSVAQNGDGPVIVNSSRAIIYASPGRDFAEAAAREAEALRERLEKLRL